MVTLNISLPDGMKEFIDREIAHYGHPSADAYFEALLRQEQRRLARADLQAQIREGLEGPMVELDGDEWESIRHESKSRAGAPSESPRPLA